MIRRKKSVAIVGLILIAVAIGLAVTWPMRLRPEHKTDAARHIIAWIVEGRRIPGCGRDHPHSEAMTEMEALVVVCGFLPQSAQLSSDSRVEHLDRLEDLLDRGDHPKEKTAYLLLELRHESSKRLDIAVGSLSHATGGYGCLLVFRRTLFLGLAAHPRSLPHVMHSFAEADGPNGPEAWRQLLSYRDRE